MYITYTLLTFLESSLNVYLLVSPDQLLSFITTAVLPNAKKSYKQINWAKNSNGVAMATIGKTRKQTSPLSDTF